MSDARERILDRARRGLAAHGGDEAARMAAAKARIAAREQTAPIPQISTLIGPRALSRFQDCVEAVSGTVTRLSSYDALPRELAKELRSHNLPQAIRFGSDPLLNELDFGELDVTHGPGRVEEPATLSRAFCGIAETGTLMLLSGPENPVTLTFLGENHFVALDANDVVGGFEEAWARLRDSGRHPRTVNLVTGPSRTADIGQQLELGAHGPISLHVFLVGG